jgi:putative salt-induced outer membrane protein
MKILIALHPLLAPPVVALASDPPPPPPQGWSGSGEAGVAAASGNTRSEDLNAKVVLKYNDERWKNELSTSALRTKASVTTM